MTNMTQQLPTLYHQSKSGAIVQWNIWTEGADIVRAHDVGATKRAVAVADAIYR